MCNTKISVMANSLRPRSDTEVPSYSWGALLDLGGKALGGLGNLVSSGAGALGNLVSNVPVVGNVVGDVISHAGAGLGNIVSGNISGGLGSLYTAADTALGGVLPGVSGAYNVPLTAAVGQDAGWLSNLYSGADKMLGGHLPNFGTFSQYTSPAQAAAQQAALAAQSGGVPVNGVGNGYGGVQAGGGGGGFWDTAGKIANTAQIVGGLYGMIKGPKGGGAGASDAQAQAQYRQMTGGTPGTAIKPGVQGANTGSRAQAGGVGVGSGVGGATTKGQGKNQTGGLEQLKSGISESEAIMQKTKELHDEFQQFIKDSEDDYKYVATSPMDEARSKTPLTPEFDGLGASYNLRFPGANY
jgi:hypothetical protein